MSPQRIQLSRQRGYRKPEGAIVVSRPSRWGNPFRSGEGFQFVDAQGALRMGVAGDQESVVRLFQEYLDARGDADLIVRELRGHDLACWCKPGDPCHADILLAIANGASS